MCLLLMEDFGQGAVLGMWDEMGRWQGLSGLALAPLKASQVLKVPVVRLMPRVWQCGRGHGVHKSTCPPASP